MSKYELALRKLLVKRKIVDLQIDPEGYPIIVLDNNMCVVIMQDPEGNGPGALSFQTKDGEAWDENA